MVLSGRVCIVDATMIPSTRPGEYQKMVRFARCPERPVEMRVRYSARDCARYFQPLGNTADETRVSKNAAASSSFCEIYKFLSFCIQYKYTM